MHTRIESIHFETVDGAIYRLSDDYNTTVLGFEGEGLPPIDYITQTSPNQHGETVLDYRIRPRTIQVLHRKSSCDRQAYWELRADILNKLRPNRSTTICPGRLVYRLPGNKVRCVDVWPMEGPKFASRNLEVYDEYAITETLRFVAFNPIFYDPTQVSRTVSYSPAQNIVFPITFPIIFSSNGIYESFTITYDGTWASYPYITLTGPMSGFILQHVELGIFIKFLRNIASGEVITIDTSFGNISAVSSLYGNVLSSFSADSSLVGMRILTEGEVTGGVNTFAVASNGADINTSVVISYYKRFIGI